MKAIKGWPPNIDLIDKRFNVKNKSGILYCYADTIYYPDGYPIPDWLVAHEYVHSQRQFEQMVSLTSEELSQLSDKDKNEIHIKGAEIWWEHYCEDDEFRLEEELLAHQRELDVYKASHNRHFSRSHLNTMAERLSSEMYGNMISKKEAKRLIKD